MKGYSPRLTYDIVLINVAISLLFTALRCYTRGVVIKKFWIDDWLALLAPVCLAAKPLDSTG